MSRISAIAINTFREAVRDKILYVLVIFGLLLIVASQVLSPITLGQQEKIIKDIGLASISIFGVLIILFVGTGLLYKELDKRTIYTIISKPIYRYQFILGKYFGLLLTLLSIVLIMTLIFYLFLWFSSSQPNWYLLVAILLIYMKLAVVTALAIMFSVVSSPTLSATFTFIIYFVGHVSSDMLYFTEKIESALAQNILTVFYYALPNLDYFNIKREVVHNITFDPSFYGFAVLYGLCYILAALAVSIMVFERKDFK